MGVFLLFKRGLDDKTNVIIKHNFNFVVNTINILYNIIRFIKEKNNEQDNRVKV